MQMCTKFPYPHLFTQIKKRLTLTLHARLAACANIANIAKNVNTANCARLRTVRDILGANTANTAIIVQNAGCAKSFVD